MSRLQEIERQIDQLPADEFAELMKHMLALDQERWDRQMDEDAAAGRLDRLVDEARAAREAGLLKDWPPSE